MVAERWLTPRRAKNIAATFFIGLAFFPGLVSGYYALQAWQHAHFPIIEDFTVTKAAFGGDRALSIRGTFRKRFGWCAYDGTTWFVTMPDGLQERVGWDSADQDPSIPRNRPPGYQSFGPWTIYVQKFIQAETLTGVVDHICLGIWSTRTILGPISLPVVRGEARAGGRQSRLSFESDIPGSATADTGGEHPDLTSRLVENS